MKKHLLCLTVDTDPDGLSGRVTNRQTLKWDGLEQLQTLPEELDKLGPIPITWFVRADGQLERVLGSAAYLLEKYVRFWTTVQAAGHELGWHPHLYRQAKSDSPATLISDPLQARDELERLWTALKSDFHPTAFRNGEGWHTSETYSAIEQMGFSCDSTTIPGRCGTPGHPMNWIGAPNQPYFPSLSNLCQAGSSRPMVELPMNTWPLQAQYDKEPKLRYMNPAVHPHLFAKALKSWENECSSSTFNLFVWVMIFHPDEVIENQAEDGLYAHSTRALWANIVFMRESLHHLGHDFQWVTISRAAEQWRKGRERLIA